MLRALVLIGMIGGVMFTAGARNGNRTVSVEGFDSGTRVVREVAEALTGNGRSILECYPWGSRTFLGFVSLFPELARIAWIEWGMRLSVGHPPREADLVDIRALAEWCVDQYPSRPYEAIVVGSPNGAVAHLSALLGAPFLTTSFGLTFRHPTIDAGDHHAYLEATGPVVASIRAAHSPDDVDVIIHYDPLHDRSIVEVASFVRMKLKTLPAAYADFVNRHLAPDGRLILTDCAYTWPQIDIGNSVFLQVGGLGAIAPETYAERWPVNRPTVIRRESEWGCPEGFAEAVSQWAAERGIDLLEIRFEHPWTYSLLAHDAYRACVGAREDLLLIDSFNHLNPRTNVATGLPALWLPFNTAEGPALVEAALQGTSLERILFAPLPSFAGSPDTAQLASWMDLLDRFGPVELIGTNPRLYPTDPLAPFRFVGQLDDLRGAFQLDHPLRLDPATLQRLVEDRN